jgi:hypothetical protein
MLKMTEMSHPKSCLNKARMDERIFVLLGRDVAAPGAIREWCRLRCLHRKNTPKDAQITEALECASLMERELGQQNLGKEYLLNAQRKGKSNG